MNNNDLYYDLNDNRKTVALIFNHYFINDPKPRYGTHEDCARIDKCFKSFGFHSTSFEDSTFGKIRETLEEVSKRSIQEINCIVVVVMTHGSVGGQLKAFDGNYSTKSLFQPFMEKDSLAGIPKLFFIQACRGANFSEGYMISSDAGHTVTTDIPFVADFLCMYSTMSDNYSLRDTITGSWFIQALCDIFEDELYRKMDLLQMLTFVIKKVAYRNVTNTADEADIDEIQLPQFVSTLTKFFKFKSRT